MSKTTNRFVPEVRERAVRMVDHERDYSFRWAAVVSSAEKIGWVSAGHCQSNEAAICRIGYHVNQIGRVLTLFPIIFGFDQPSIIRFDDRIIGLDCKGIKFRFV